LHPFLTRLSAMSDLQLFSTRRSIPDRGGGLMDRPPTNSCAVA
jgi:hypothetical protein